MPRPIDVDSLRSAAAAAGRSGYWAFDGEITVKWAFEAGLPDPATFPIDDLARIHEDVLRRDADDALQYGGGANGSIVYGWEGLRDRLLERTVARDGGELDRRSVMLTSGGAQALSLACDALLDPDDVAIVEAPSWEMVLTSARRRGAEIVAVPVDEDGLRVDLLEAVLDAARRDGRRVKLLYTIATFHTPTGVCLSLERRRRLVELAAEYDFLILEDHVYGDLRYEGDAIPTIRSLDANGRVLTVESFSKTLAPALRLGWVTGHPDVVGAVSAVRGDLGVSQWTARVMEQFLAEDRFDPHLARVNALYRRKRDVAVAALAEHCSDHVKWNTPQGGFFLWLELDPAIDGKKVMQHALAEGVYCRPGERFFGDPDEGRSFLRLSFVMVPIEELERGIAVLGRAIEASGS